MNPSPVTVHAPYLNPAARLMVATAACAWAAGRAVAVAEGIEALIESVNARADALAGSQAPVDELVAIAGEEARILILARAGRQYAAAAGASCPSWVHDRLDALAGSSS